MKLRAYRADIPPPYLANTVIPDQNNRQTFTVPFITFESHIFRLSYFPVFRVPPRLLPVNEGDNATWSFIRDDNVAAMKVAVGELDGALVRKVVAGRHHRY